MTITTQTNEQECGVCALTSLHNHFYSHDLIDKQKVLEESNVNYSGLTIFDLEVLGNKLGLECESYEIKWSEFLSLKLNSYFIFLISNNGESNHYVIGKKKKGGIEIYDSSLSKPITVKYSELQNKFLGILILVTKKANKTFKSTFSKPRTLLMFDLKFIVLNILLSILLFGTAILSAKFLNWIIDIAISNKSINNLLTLSFEFIFIFCAGDIIEYITNIYSSGHLKTYCLLFTSKILSSLRDKNIHFFDKVDKRWMFKIDECVYSISNFCVVEINKLISNIIFTCVCVCIVGIIQPYLLIFAFVIPFVQFLFFLFAYRKKKELFVKITNTENMNSVFYKNLMNSLSNEFWYSKREKWTNLINKNYSNIYKNFNDSIIFRSNTSLFKGLVKSIIEVLFIGTCAYLIIKKDSLTIGKLTFILATIGLYKDCTDGIFGYFLSSIEFNVYWQVYKDITEVGNIQHKKQILELEKISSIEFINQELKTQISSRKDNYLNVSAITLFKKSNFIKLNDEIYDANSDVFINNLIICDENTNYFKEQFMELFENNSVMFSKYIRYFHIDLDSDNVTFLNSIILNLLSLSTAKNKIIIIDCVLDYFKDKDQLMVKEILNKIQLENDVFIIRKDSYD